MEGCCDFNKLHIVFSKIIFKYHIAVVIVPFMLFVDKHINNNTVAYNLLLIATILMCAIIMITYEYYESGFKERYHKYILPWLMVNVFIYGLSVIILIVALATNLSAAKWLILIVGILSLVIWYFGHQYIKIRNENKELQSLEIGVEQEI